MRNPKELSRDEVIRTASAFHWTKKMPKWRVVIGDRELPARPLILEAAGVAPNDPTNSHQAVAILERLGFETRYERDAAKNQEKPSSMETTPIADVILQIAKEIPECELAKIPSDLSKNLDRYLYKMKTGK
jgi:hypothetical protein